MAAKNKYISSQETRTQVTRKMLLETAIDLVNKHGMKYLTIRNICDEAGISTGSFYNLFDGKDDLVAYYLSNIFTSYKQKAEEQASGHSHLEKIILIYRFYIDCVMETGLEFITGLYATNTNPLFNFLEREEENEVIIDLVREDIEGGIAAGEIKTDTSVNEMLLHIASIITGTIYYWCVFEGRIDLAYQTDAMLQAYLRLLSTDPNIVFDVPPIPRKEDALI